MTFVFYQLADDTWKQYRCPQSDRYRFDIVEANMKCRWLVHNRFGVAAEARVVDEVHARWEWSDSQQAAVQKSGPDF